MVQLDGMPSWCEPEALDGTYFEYITRLPLKMKWRPSTVTESARLAPPHQGALRLPRRP